MDVLTPRLRFIERRMIALVFRGAVARRILRFTDVRIGFPRNRALHRLRAARFRTAGCP